MLSISRTAVYSAHLNTSPCVVYRGALHSRVYICRTPMHVLEAPFVRAELCGQGLVVVYVAERPVWDHGTLMQKVWNSS